eukprot:5871396-Prymnesium_polylepis.1
MVLLCGTLLVSFAPSSHACHVRVPRPRSPLTHGSHCDTRMTTLVHTRWRRGYVPAWPDRAPCLPAFLNLRAQSLLSSA